MSRDPEFQLRPGTLGILLVCLAIQLLIWRNHAGQAKAIELLKFGPIGCTAGKVQAGGLALAEDYGILKKTGITILGRPAVAQARLDAIRKNSLARRLSVKAGEFKPLALVTSLFAHVDWLHFAFNAWLLLLVGSVMEGYWGTRTFLALCAAGGIAGQLAFLVFGGLGGSDAGHSLGGLTPVIAALACAFLLTQGGSKVDFSDLVLGNPMVVSPRRQIGIWSVLLLLEAVWLGGYSGGASLSALIAGGFAGLVMANLIPGTLPRYRPGSASIG